MRYIFLSVAFLFCWACGHCQLAFSSNQSINLHNSHLTFIETPSLFLPTRSEKPPVRLINKISIGIAGASLLTGSILLSKSKSSYNSYKNLKNDIIYTQNNFSEADLQQYKIERKELYDKAERQRRAGNKFLLLGSVCTVYVGIIFIFGEWRESPKYD